MRRLEVYVNFDFFFAIQGHRLTPAWHLLDNSVYLLLLRFAHADIAVCLPVLHRSSSQYTTTDSDPRDCRNHDRGAEGQQYHLSYVYRSKNASRRPST